MRIRRRTTSASPQSARVAPPSWRARSSARSSPTIRRSSRPGWIRATTWTPCTTSPMPEKIGRYEDLEVIGRGGMGVIYKARDPVLERSVALKAISSVELPDDLRARLYREARACARLRDHPNIVTLQG